MKTGAFHINQIKVRSCRTRVGFSGVTSVLTRRRKFGNRATGEYPTSQTKIREVKGCEDSFCHKKLGDRFLDGVGDAAVQLVP